MLKIHKIHVFRLIGTGSSQCWSARPAVRAAGRAGRAGRVAHALLCPALRGVVPHLTDIQPRSFWAPVHVLFLA
jgi:hypothetical protein